MIMPPRMIPVFMYLPPKESSGSYANASIAVLMGVYEMINKDEIMVIILAIFRLRPEILSACVGFMDFLVQLVALRSLITSVIVHTMMITNAAMGMEKFVMV